MSSICNAIVILRALLVGNRPSFGWIFFVVLAEFAIVFGYFLIIYSRAEEPRLSSTDCTQQIVRNKLVRNKCTRSIHAVRRTTAHRMNF